MTKGRIQYLVKWEGYSSASNTWEDEENCVHCSSLIIRFLKEPQGRKDAESQDRKVLPVGFVGSDNQKSLISLSEAKEHDVNLCD
jgi:hypothetical protein